MTFSESLARWLFGTWCLEEFVSVGADGAKEHVMGFGATGFITYGPDGWMSVQIMGQSRLPYDKPAIGGGTSEEMQAAAASYFAYGGRYFVDEVGMMVRHQIEFSLLPNWVGLSQTRHVRRDSPNRLLLTSDQTLIDGHARTMRIIWSRMDIHEDQFHTKRL